jgi:DNA-binding IclR family transcriptional regulator
MQDPTLAPDVIDHATAFEPDCDDSTIKSAKRVLQILELFKEMRRPMFTTDIAVQLNYPVSSTAALLKSLTSLGYVVFDRSSRTYQASLRVALLGSWTPDGGIDAQALSAVTNQLAHQSGMAAVLAIRNNNHVQYVRVVPHDSKLRFYLPVGSRQRLVDTAMGRAILSLDDDAAVDRMVRRANADRKSHQPRIDPLELKAEIAQIRERGYACSIDGFFKGAGAVAVPLVGDDGEPLVLGLGGPADHVRERIGYLIDLVTRAADDIREAASPAILDEAAYGPIARYA